MMETMKTLTLQQPHASLAEPHPQPGGPEPLPGEQQSAVGWPQALEIRFSGILSDHGSTASPVGWPATVSRETTRAHDTLGPATGHDSGTTADDSDVADTATVVGDSVSLDPAPAETAVGAPASVDPPPAATGGDVSRETRDAGAARTVVAAHTTDLPRPLEPRVLTVANQKGGVGKTTTAVNMAAALSQSGLQVLVIDMDPQGNASTALGIDHGEDVAGIYDVLIDGTPLEDVVQESPSLPGLLCAPATIDLAGAEIELVPMVARESRLRKAVTAFLQMQKSQGSRIDYVFIDCPPSLGLLTVNSFVAGSEVLIPIQCEYYALEGLSQLLTNIDLIKEHLNPGLVVSHILLTMYDGRTRLSSQVADEVRQHFGDTVLRTSIPRSVRISEAPSHGETVITYDPISSGALCYLEAAKEVARFVRAGEEGSTDE